jgi:hypothetical protein
MAVPADTLRLFLATLLRIESPDPAESEAGHKLLRETIAIGAA